jgi:hypothetical protein
VEQSDCVSVIPALMLAAPDIARRFHHRPLSDPCITRPIGLIVPRDGVLSPTAEAFARSFIAQLALVEAKKYPYVRFLPAPSYLSWPHLS